MQTGIFAENASKLGRLGLAVIPLDGKKPLVGSFNKLTRPPAPQAIDRWSARFANANIGVVVGPSKLIVVDCDDQEAVQQAQEIFGPTPLRALTSRGCHLNYSDSSGKQRSTNLRKFQLNIDIKCGAGFVVAPPSLHSTGIRYRLDDGCDWSALNELPRSAPFRHDAMNRFRPAAQSSVAPALEGNRANSLNALLCSDVFRCETIEHLLAVARSRNATMLPPLLDDEVTRISRRVWADASCGKLSRWLDGQANVRIAHDDLLDLLKSSSKGSDAIALLLHLQASHGARCARGELFSVTPKAIVAQKVMGDWSRGRVEDARDLLIERGLLTCVRLFVRKGMGALYTLKPRNVGTTGAAES